MLNKSTRNRKYILTTISFALVLFMVFSLVSLVSAHQTITVGDYSLEYGWVNEPAVAGQPNAVVINLGLTSATAPADVDVSGLKVEVTVGGQSKVLTLQPLGENTPGQFIAPLTPMVPGMYTVHVSGNIGSTTFNNDVVPEEVKTADVVQFPLVTPVSASTSAPLGTAGWLGIIGIVFGVAGVLIGVVALTRKPGKG